MLNLDLLGVATASKGASRMFTIRTVRSFYTNTCTHGGMDHSQNHSDEEGR